MSNNILNSKSETNLSLNTAKPTNKNPRLSILEKKEVLEVNITQEIYDKIRFLCQQIPKVEWSGVLFYSTQGSIKEPNTFKITIEEILLMDKGTTTATDYNFNQEVIDFVEAVPNRIDWRYGLIHSHNTMPTYFSSVDMDELQDNTPNHNYYLSLIVNNFMDLTAKVAYILKTTSSFGTAEDEEGVKYEIPLVSSQKLLAIHNCKIITPQVEFNISKEFADRTKLIISQAEKRDAAKSVYKVDYGTMFKSPEKKLYKPNDKLWENSRKQGSINWDEIEKDLDELDEMSLDFLDEVADEFCLFLLRDGQVLQGDSIDTALDDIQNLFRADFDTYIRKMKMNFTYLWDNYFKEQQLVGEDDKEEILDICIDIVETYAIANPLLTKIVKTLKQIQNGK